MDENVEGEIRQLRLELKKANREVKRLHREMNLLSVMNEQVNRFHEVSEANKGRQVYYTKILLENSPNVSIVDMIPRGMEMSGFYAYGEVCPVKTNENRLRNAFHNTTFSLLVM